MRVTYRIYGYYLQLDFINDSTLLSYFNELVGKIVDNRNEVSGKFIFEKKTSKFLEEYYEKKREEYKNFQEVYVQPTGENGEVAVDQEQDKAIHYYKNHYFIEYLYSKQRVVFYYSENFYQISSLLMEFFKYYLFYISVEEGRFPLHSSCITNINSREVVLFVGNSGCGKSSNAILSSLNEEYCFNNDEVTYVSEKPDGFRVTTTDDKVKICTEMFQQLMEMGLMFEFIEAEGEYICDFKGRNSYTECNDINTLEISKVFLLDRDDSINNMEIFVPNTMQKGELIFPNMHVSLWTTKAQKRKIIHMANSMISKLNFTYIKYPTKRIKEVFDFVNERLRYGV